MSYHLVRISLLRVGDEVLGYGHGSCQPSMASYYPFDDKLIVRSIKKFGAGFTSITLGPPNNSAITSALEDETTHGDHAAVSQDTLKKIRERGPCSHCGRAEP